MRLGASIVGDLRKVLADEVKAGERAAMSAIRAETDQVKAELRRQVTTAFSGNTRGIANAWRSMIFPRSGQSLRPAGLVFTKVPNVIDAFERGALIQPKGGGKFLAIPTGFNAARGRRGRGEKGMRVTPAQMVASSGPLHFPEASPIAAQVGLVWHPMSNFWTLMRTDCAEEMEFFARLEDRTTRVSDDDLDDVGEAARCRPRVRHQRMEARPLVFVACGAWARSHNPRGTTPWCSPG